MLVKGAKAPDFSLPDQDEKIHNLSDYHGQKLVLYFYPKDDTPGCTIEACAIAEVYDEFENKEVKVFGVSADNPASHKVFAKKYNLPFVLLSDPFLKTIKDYGAYKEDTTGSGVNSTRITYIIDEEGRIEKVYPEVDPATHAHKVLSDLG